MSLNKETKICVLATEVISSHHHLKVLKFQTRKFSIHIIIFRKLIVLALCSIVKYIDNLTASFAIKDFSPWGMVGVCWPIFDGVSWHIYFQ